MSGGHLIFALVATRVHSRATRQTKLGQLAGKYQPWTTGSLADDVSQGCAGIVGADDTIKYNSGSGVLQVDNQLLTDSGHLRTNTVRGAPTGIDGRRRMAEQFCGTAKDAAVGKRHSQCRGLENTRFAV